MGLTAAVLGVIVLLHPNFTSAQTVKLTADQVAEVEDLLREAGTQFREANYREAARMVTEAERQLTSYGPPNSGELQRRVSAIERSLRNARAALELQGISISEAPRPAKPSSRDAAPAAESAAISFRSQVAPILVEHCLDCHNDDDRSGGFSLARFASLREGGRRGVPWQANQPGSSLIIAKLQGTADGQAMPLGEPPLKDEQIALLARWIQEGATNDAESEDQALTSILAAERMQNATTEELNHERAKVAETKWQLAFPSLKATRTETNHFLVLSSVGPTETQAFAQQAESNWAKVKKLLRLSSEQGPRGRITLFLVDQVYLLGEFARMVEQRELPRPANHVFWSPEPSDPYAVVLWKSEDDDAIDPTPRGLTGLLLSADGELPGWFVQGLADTVAQRLSPQTPRIARLADLQGTFKYALREPDDFIQGRVPIEVSDAAAMSFVQFLMRQGRNFPRLISEGQVTQGQKGQAFASRVEAAYGSTLDDLLAAWWRGIEGPRRGR